MEPRIDRLVSWARGHPAPPVVVECHLTNHCNLACRFCWLRIADPSTFKDELPDSRFLELVEESARLGALEWRIIGGGEPLVRRATALAMMKQIKHLNMQGMLTTNGMLLDDEFIDQMIADGWNTVTFSIDGPDASIHDGLRGREGAFAAAYRALIRLRDRKTASRSPYPEVRFHTVLCRENFRHLDRLVDLAAEVNCAQVLLQPMTIYAESMRCLALTREDEQWLQEALDDLTRRAAAAGVWTNFESMRETDLVEKTTAMDEVIRQDLERVDDAEPFLSIPCYEPWYLLLIRPDGLVTPCNKFDYAGADGSVNSLEEIWYGDFFQHVRETLMKGNLLPICSTCCVGGVLENRRVRELLREAVSESKGAESSGGDRAVPAKGSMRWWFGKGLWNNVWNGVWKGFMKGHQSVGSRDRGGRDRR
ncbi:radical SAM protein [bacterium]|nr:radical SAM protein [candidate division CSSED10-310 bacterium]